jgi:protein-L-isoaspartate(D-aspartate) O-methyltransferase
MTMTQAFHPPANDATTIEPTTFDAPPFDAALARNLMVDGQLRPNKVRDPRLIEVLRRLPRERFVPAPLRQFAYIDADLKLSARRVMIKPLVIARLIQLAAPRAGETALVVGSGTGYAAAILAELGVLVTALEEDDQLIALAREAAIPSQPVDFVTGKLADGWAARAPYDFVLIEGAVRAIPERIGRQVAQNGRLVTVLAPEGASPTAVLAEPSLGGMRARPAFDAATALLPELLPAPAFAF